MGGGKGREEKGRGPDTRDKPKCRAKGKREEEGEAPGRVPHKRAEADRGQRRQKTAGGLASSSQKEAMSAKTGEEKKKTKAGRRPVRNK